MAAMGKSIGAHVLSELLGDWRQGGGSAYRRLAMSVRALVLDGRVAVESRLPAERDLASALAVSRTTVAASYERLRAEGYVTSRRGAGSFVAMPKGRAAPGGGDEMIDLATAAMSAPEPWLSRAMAAAAADLPRYACTHGDFPAGLEALRRAIAVRYEQRGLPTAPEQIMVTSGATGAFMLLLRELTVPADRVAVESPGHPNFLRALSLIGAAPVAVRMPDDGWDIGEWAAAFRTAAPRLAFVAPDFHSPTGLLMSEEPRRELVSMSRSTGVNLLVDETMAELSLDPGRLPLPLAAYDSSGTNGTVITVGSAGKTFWSGLRIGWIRATPELIRRLAARRAGLDIASPVIEQLAVAQLLNDEATLAEVLVHQRDRVRSRRDALVTAVRRELRDWTFRVPAGGLGLWVRTGGESASVLATAAGHRGVRLAAGPCHGTDGFLEEFVRLPFTQPPEVIDEAVRRIGAVREQGPPRHGAAPTAPATL